jgi:molybdopterin synthase catalytic subunit
MSPLNEKGLEIKVLYFAYFRDRVGKREELVSVANGTKVGDLRDQLMERHSAIAESLPSAVMAVNHEFAFSEDQLQDGDEVAIFPPVSGGTEDSPTVLRITEDEVQMDELLDELILPTTGAACIFTGVVRGKTSRGEGHETLYLEYEAYRSMAVQKLRQVAEEIRARWPEVSGIALVQRIGRLDPGTPTVLIACTAAHRDSGVFEASRYGIDRLKEVVPIWKKEVGPMGDYWVEGDYHPDKEDRRN